MRLHTARYSDMQRHGLGLGTWTGKMAWLLLALLCCVLSVKVQGQGEQIESERGGGRKEV